MDLLSLDFETRSEANLPDVGSSVYSRHPTTKVLMAAYAFNQGAVHQWDAHDGEPIPKILLEALIDRDVQKWAWNAPFEMQMTNQLIAAVDVRQWRCTMVQAMHCSLPGKLEKAGPCVGLPMDMQKDRRGKALMRKFSIPRKPTIKNPRLFTEPEDAPQEYLDYLEYNRSDVVAERGIRNRLLPYLMSSDEWELWFLDQEINNAGLPINLRMVRNAIRIYEHALTTGLDEMKEISGLSNPNSGAQLLPWLQERGYMFDDLKKGNVATAIKYFKDQPEHWEEDRWLEYRSNNALKTVLELRKETSRTSIKKFYALERATDTDGNLRHVLQMNGAARTGRYAGRIYQPQNLPRPEKRFEDIQPLLARNVEELDHDSLKLVHGNVFDVLASTLRPSAQAPEGMIFVDADLSAIENRVLGWLAGCDKILRVFHNNLDPYLSFATYLYNEPYDKLYHEYKVLKHGEKRTIAKPGTLGCPRGDTLVLTKRGWVRLDRVQDDDFVHDGVCWVRHGGVVCQGVRSCVNLSGVVITGDHKVWQGGESWLEAEKQSWLSWNRATEAAALSLSATSKTDPILDRFISVDAIADAFWSNAELASWHRTGHNGGALNVPEGSNQEAVNELVETFLTCSQTGSTQSGTGAKIRKVPGSKAMGRAVSSAYSAMLKSSSAIASMFSVLTGLWKSTEKTTTVITSREISDLGIEVCKTPIAGIATKSNTEVDGIPQQSSGECLPQNTETIARLPAKPEKGKPQTKSSPVSLAAGEHMTFDILHAGPRNRFVILSAAGPIIIHNCGYGMGAGEEWTNSQTGEIEASGLLGYAWGMGVTAFTKADAKHSVDTFRREFKEVVTYWYDLERAARKCIRTQQPIRHGFVSFDIKGPFLRMILPSGRPLYYLRPKLEEVMTPWGEMKVQITYEGLNDRKQWVRMHTTPGKLTENADQAISRDLLVHGIKLAKKRGIDVRLHVHDQIIGLVKEEDAEKSLAVLRECMEDVPKWAPGLPLGSAGLATKVFIKD